MNDTGSLALVALCAYAMGYVAAIPVGATQLEIARRALHGRIKAALLVAAGSVSSDLTYGLIAIYGLAPFLHDTRVVAALVALGSVISLVLGAWIVRTSRRQAAEIPAKTLQAKSRKGLSYVTGFTFAFTNPLMMGWWLLGMQALRDFHVHPIATHNDQLAFLGAGAAGIASYHVTLTFLVHRAKRFATEETIRRITVAFGAGLFCIGLYLLWRVVAMVVM